jgi:hypothetical protein
MRKDDRHVDRPTETVERRLSIGGISFQRVAVFASKRPRLPERDTEEQFDAWLR